MSEARRRHWDGQQRPPWWPEGEPFPPQNWARMRHRFMRRFFVFALIAFVLFATILGLFVSLFIQLFSAMFGGPPHPAVLVVGFLLMVFVFSNIARTTRRFASRLGDLVEAAERVESGDYSVRVRPRGTREMRALANAFNSMSARLESSEAERRRLLADVTHELRTPLTVVQGNVEALIDGVHPADETHLRAILDETQVISRLIDDLRTVSIAEAGALALHRETTDLAGLVRDVFASFAAQATAQGVTTSVDAPASLVAEVDPIRVREILTNIVANALRYTPRDGVIRASVTSDESVTTVAIEDTGPGIAPDVLPHVFERFTRSPESPGAGLGLAIAKSLVTAHGGTIEARSELGQGTEIRFSLPRA